jgi:hypothetical protein
VIQNEILLLGFKVLGKRKVTQNKISQASMVTIPSGIFFLAKNYFTKNAALEGAI